MRTWVFWRRDVPWMAVLYLLAGLVVAGALTRSRGPVSDGVGASFLLLVVILALARMRPVFRLLWGLLAVAVVSYGSAQLDVAQLVSGAVPALFVLSFTVPTWLAPAILAVVFGVEVVTAGTVSWVALGTVEVAALAFGMLAEQKKRLERDRRDLSSASGELSQTLRQVEYLAFHDPLTGLPNRRLVTERLDEALSAAAQSRGSLAVAFVDLDRFKAVNDGAGHAFGDRILKFVGSTINRFLQPGDVAGRQGGDEFILVLRSQGAERTMFDRLERLRQALNEEIVLDGHHVFATASFGVALFPEDGTSSDELLRHADMALYRAKEEGRNRVALYNEDLEHQAAAAFYLDSSLRKAVAADQFFLEYQPQVDILTGRTVGLEALLRWRSPDQHRVLPDAFLPEANTLGMMQEIDAWVLERALREVGSLPWWRHHPVTLAVNVSATSLESSDFVPFVLQCMEGSGVLPGRFELEITESVLSRKADIMAERLGELRRCGIGVAIDDFGVGYSSLSHLQNFPASRIKIDRGFVADITRSDSIARAIVAVAKSLKLDIVAEGVETREQAERLLELGCDVAQGFYYDASLALAHLPLKYDLDVRRGTS